MRIKPGGSRSTCSILLFLALLGLSVLVAGCSSGESGATGISDGRDSNLGSTDAAPSIVDSNATTSLATASPTASPTPSPTPGPPNIVFILMDDMRADQMEFMPTTVALFAESGIVFENSIVSFAECCPARATALTGQYAHNHGVLSGDLPSGGVTRFDPSAALPVWLAEAGYRSMLVGKYLNGYGQHAPPDVPPGWEDWFALMDPSTVNWYDFDVYDNGQVRSFGKDEHRTHVLGDRAVADIESAAASDQPFMLWFAPVAPHIGYKDRESAELGTGVFGVNGVPSALLPGAGWFPPPERVGALDNYRWDPPQTFGGADREGKPLEIATATDLPATQIDDVGEDYRRVGETLLGVDDAIGRIVDSLERTGELDNTVIIFTSDNGFFFGEHRLVYLKYWPYEEGIRVPLMVRGPGFTDPAGLAPGSTTLSAPVANIDLAPTMAAIAEATPRLEMDGVALQSVIAEPEHFAHRPLLIETGPTFGRPVYAGVRIDDAKYIEYRDGFAELYDLAVDPIEAHNVWGDLAYAVRRDELALLLGALRACAGDSCRDPMPSPDAAPVAIIDPTMPMYAGIAAFLNGSGSFDPDGGPLTYEWSQTAGPPVVFVGEKGKAIQMLGIAFEGTLEFTLEVTDDEGATGSATLAIVPG